MIVSRFKTGDAVQLKTGGPVMIVADAHHGSGADRITCRWSAGSRLSVGVYAVEELNPADEPQGTPDQSGHRRHE